jgi:hypothetical protein
MSVVLSTYSGKDLNFSLANPLVPTLQVAGIAAQGVAQITVRMTVTQSSLQTGMDGSVVPSVIPGDMGEIEIQVWQTSTIHQQLLTWYNALKSARDLGDVSEWFGATVLVQNIVDGSSHSATGVGPAKVPDKTYAEQAGRITWVLMAANITNQ